MISDVVKPEKMITSTIQATEAIPPLIERRARACSSLVEVRAAFAWQARECSEPTLMPER